MPAWCNKLISLMYSQLDMFRVHTPIIRSIRCWVAAHGFLHRVFWMGGGLESRCVGRVGGADVAVRRMATSAPRTYIHTHTHTHTYIHTYIHPRTYIRRYIDTYIPTYTHTYIHTYIHTLVHKCVTKTEGCGTRHKYTNIHNCTLQNTTNTSHNSTIDLLYT